MKKKLFILFISACLIYSGVAYAFSAVAVKNVVSGALIKACGTVPANDNRCIRLVTGGSQVLGTVATSALFLAKSNWITLALSLVVPLVTEYLFKIGSKEVTVQRQDEDIIVKEVKEPGSSDIPVITNEAVTFGAPSHHESWFVTNPELINYDTRNDGNGYYYYSDPHKVSFVGGSKGGLYVHNILMPNSEVDNRISPTFFEISDAQKYIISYYKNYVNKYITVYKLEDGIFTSTGSFSGIFNFVDEHFYPFYYTTSSYKQRFQGYMSKVEYTDDEVRKEGYILIYYDGVYDNYTQCTSGQYEENGICHNLQEAFSDIPTSDNVNALANELLSEPIITYPNQPINEWLESLPAEEKNVLVSDDLIVDFIDEVYEQATSQVGYDGVPYVEGVITSDLIQNLDVSIPTIGDMITPINNPVPTTGGGLYLSPDPTTAVDPIPDTPEIVEPSIPGSGAVGDQNVDVDLDLGPYPDIQEPGLAEPPSSSEILAPIFGLFPELRNYEVPTHESVCPRPSFEAFGETYTIEQHCDLMENNRILISSIFILLWSICALTVFLKA